MTESRATSHLLEATRTLALQNTLHTQMNIVFVQPLESFVGNLLTNLIAHIGQGGYHVLAAMRVCLHVAKHLLIARNTETRCVLAGGLEMLV